jgi:HEAT repeat protein
MIYLKSLRIASLVLVIGLLAAPGAFAASPIPRKDKPRPANEVDQFLLRWKDPAHRELLMVAGSALRSETEPERIDAVRQTVASFQMALDDYEDGDPRALTAFGGVKKFKTTVAGWLVDKNESVRSYAALLLGVCGDRAYAGRIGRLLNARTATADEPLPTDRGNAATALGLMNAGRYKPVLITLLSSANEYDRAGAVYGLGYLKAKDQELAIGRLLYDKNDVVRDAAEKALAIISGSE